MLADNQVDIVAIQETKKETFTHRALRSISSKFDKWIWLESKGRSGGILFGCDSDNYSVIDSVVHTYLVDIWLQNRHDRCTWILTIVYAPIDRSLKSEFWNELR